MSLLWMVNGSPRLPGLYSHQLSGLDLNWKIHAAYVLASIQRMPEREPTRTLMRYKALLYPAIGVTLLLLLGLLLVLYGTTC